MVNCCSFEFPGCKFQFPLVHSKWDSCVLMTMEHRGSFHCKTRGSQNLMIPFTNIDLLTTPIRRSYKLVWPQTNDSHGNLQIIYTIETNLDFWICVILHPNFKIKRHWFVNPASCLSYMAYGLAKKQSLGRLLFDNIHSLHAETWKDPIRSWFWSQLGPKLAKIRFCCENNNIV